MVIKQEDEEIYGRTVWGFFLKVGGSSGQCISRFANETIKSKGGERAGKELCLNTRTCS